MNTGIPLITIVIAFYNEELVLKELISRLRKMAETYDRASYEFLFVDDNSTDLSGELLRNDFSSNNDLKVITLSRRFGHMNSLFAGLEAADGDAVIYLDADLQDPPEFIPSMVDAWLDEQAIDVVYTTRRSRTGETLFRMGLTKIGYRILRKFSVIDIPVDSGDFKLISRRVVDQLLLMGEHEPFFRFLVPWVGFKQKQLFYDREARYAGQSHFDLWTTVRQFFEISLMPFSIMPLRIIAIVGLMMCILSFIMMMFYFSISSDSNVFFQNLRDWSDLIIILLLSINVFVLGIVALYVGAIFIEAKKRPRYIVKERLIPKT